MLRKRSPYLSARFTPSGGYGRTVEFRADSMRENSQLLEIEAEFNAILEKYGAFLRQTIARVCPKDLGIQYDDIEQEARLRLWRAIEAEREINFYGSYIYKIVISVTINAIRRAKARHEEQLRLAEDG